MSVSVETQLLIIVEGGVVVDAFTAIDEEEALAKFHELTGNIYRGSANPYRSYWQDEEKGPDDDIYWFTQTHTFFGSTLLRSDTKFHPTTFYPLASSGYDESDKTIEEEVTP